MVSGTGWKCSRSRLRSSAAEPSSFRLRLLSLFLSLGDGILLMAFLLMTLFGDDMFVGFGMDLASSFVCKSAAINGHIATTKNTVKKPRESPEIYGIYSQLCEIQQSRFS